MNAHFLSRVQLFDGATGVGGGLLGVLAAGPVARLTGLPEGLLREAGLFLLVFGAVVLWSARRPSAQAIGALLAMNVGWVLASVGLLLAAGLPLTTLGYGLVIVQAVAVAVIAELQWMGLRRADVAVAA